jgi:hypothetical protein
MPPIPVISAQTIASFVGSGGRKVSREMAGKMLKDADFLVSQHQKRLSVPGHKGPNGRSRPGEYPRKISGVLKDSVTVVDRDIQKIMTKGLVQIGIKTRAWYGPYLEVRYKRHGLERTLRDLIPQLKAMAGIPLRFKTGD